MDNGSLPPAVALIDFLLSVDEQQRSHEQLQKVADALMVRLFVCLPVHASVVCTPFKREENQVKGAIDLIGLDFNDLELS